MPIYDIPDSVDMSQRRLRHLSTQTVSAPFPFSLFKSNTLDTFSLTSAMTSYMTMSLLILYLSLT
jgi:hypothetical protein